MSHSTEKPITVKQARFAEFYVETGNASEAYRRAYNAENMKPQSIWTKASQVLAKGKVAVRVMELQAEARERSLVTIKSISEQYDADRDLAHSEGQAGAAVSATTAKARLHGLFEKDNTQRGGIELSEDARILLGHLSQKSD